MNAPFKPVLWKQMTFLFYFTQFSENLIILYYINIYLYFKNKVDFYFHMNSRNGLLYLNNINTEFA